jgi:hypothetical protein
VCVECKDACAWLQQATAMAYTRLGKLLR